MTRWKKYVTRSLSLYKVDVYFRGFRNALKDHFDLNFDNLLLYTKGKECGIYFGEIDLKAFADLVKNYFLEGIKQEKNPFDYLYRLQNEFVESSIELGKRNISSKKELLQAYNEFLNIMKNYQITMWFPVICENELYPYAKERLADEKAWSIITEPFEPSAIQQEFIDLLKAAIDYSDEKLAEHQKKYSWMRMNFIEDIPYDLDYFKQRLEDIENPSEELARITKDLEDRKKSFFDLLDSLNLTREDRELFISVNKLNYLRNTRDNGRRRAYYYIRPLFEKIISALGCSFDVFLSYMNDDIIKALENDVKLEKNEVNEYIHMFKDGKFEFVSENVEKRLEEEGIKLLNVKEVDKFKGSIANSGKAKGKVKVITLNNWAKDISDVEKGDILVAVSTKPDHIIAMERAAAFVTDEGGITCHAAIVSREMNKPCIVGTLIATSVLKDGDMVEVDAEKGVVRKL